MSFKSLLFFAAIALLVVAPQRAHAQQPDNDLAAKAESYRMTEASLRKFISATRQIAAAARHDPAVARYIDDGKGPQPAAVTRALSASGMSTDEYVLFFSALLYAGLAQFALDGDDAAAKASIPSTVRQNATFVREHKAELEAIRADIAVLQGES